jgi:F-type H+-transporting ATPase subunit b
MATSNENGPVTGTQVAPPAGEKPFPPFDSANFAPLLIWLALSFGLLYLLMLKVALPRVEGILRDRHTKITGDLGDAFAKRAQADQAAAAYQKTLADARANAQALAQQTHARLAAEADTRRQALEAELSAKIAAGETEIEATKAKAMANVEQIAQDTAAAIVEHLTGKPADAKAIAAAIATAKS